MTYEIIDYFDVWSEPEYDDYDGTNYVNWTVNNLGPIDETIDIDPSDDDVDILVKLTEIGFLNPSAVKDCYIDWLDDTMAEVYVRVGTKTFDKMIDSIPESYDENTVFGDYPICRLEKAR